MPPDPLNPSLPPANELRDAYRTLTGLPSPTDQLANRLQFIEDLLAGAKSLPDVPIIVWREPDHSLRHEVIGRELITGREAGRGGLTLADDKLLSRRHFAIRSEGEAWVLEDLKSRNGTAINRTENRVQSEILRDGDLIFAGNHVFVFMDQERTT